MMAQVNRESVTQVIDGMITGATVRSLCRKYELDYGTFWQYLNRNEDLYRQYARARPLQMSVMADELLDLADEPAGKENDGKYSNALVQHRRLQVDTRKWLLSKVLPKIYADKTKEDVANNDAEVDINEV
jgi:hypothetical protein